MKRYGNSQELVDDFNEQADGSQEIIVSRRKEDGRYLIEVTWKSGAFCGSRIVVPDGDSYRIVDFAPMKDARLNAKDAYRLANLCAHENGWDAWLEITNWDNWVSKRYGVKQIPLGTDPPTGKQVEFARDDKACEVFIREVVWGERLASRPCAFRCDARKEAATLMMENCHSRWQFLDVDGFMARQGV